MNITNKFSPLLPLDELRAQKTDAIPDKLLLSKQASVQQVLMKEELIPWFNISKADQRNWRNDQPAWKFTLPDLKESMKRGVRYPYVKNIDFTINPHTNRLLKVHSAWPAGVRAIREMPPPMEEERQMMQVKEQFTGLPDTPLPVDFETALKVVMQSGPASPVSAKQIIAYNVVHTTLRYSDRPVWIIHTRGIVPFEAKTPAASHQARNTIPEDARNHVRHVVDAETALWLYSDTTPQPVM